MKKSFRLFLLPVVVLAALTLNACSGVQAAQGSGSGTSLNDLSSTDVVSTASVNSNDAILGTETADASSMLDVTETPDAFGTPSVTETPGVGTETLSVGEMHSANEVVGVVSAMDATTITINGAVYKLADLPSFAATLKVGDNVKVEFVTNADGSITVREIKVSSGADSISNSNESNSNDSNSNDHNANGNSNSNESQSHDSNSNENE